MRRTAIAAVLAVVAVATAGGCFVEPEATADSGEQRLRIGLPFEPRARLSPFTDDAPIIAMPV